MGEFPLKERQLKVMVWREREEKEMEKRNRSFGGMTILSNDILIGCCERVKKKL